MKIVEEDYEDIDTSNIIPRSKRRAAVASGLVRDKPKPKPAATSSSSSGGGLLKKPKKIDDDDEEAEFD